MAGLCVAGRWVLRPTNSSLPHPRGEQGCATGRSALRQTCRDFDLYRHAWIDQSADDGGCSRARTAEVFAEDRRDAREQRRFGDVVVNAYHVVERATRLLQRLRDIAEALVA